MLDAVAKIIENAAQECILPYYHKLKEKDISTKKTPTDFVTVADIKTEQYLSDRLKKLVPSSVVIGEETAFKNPDIFETLHCHDTTVWIVDPLDGTKNFVKGKDVFGIIVSMVVNEEIIAGWIYIPLHNNTMIIGEKGSGVWSAGKRLSVTNYNEKLSNMSGTFSLSIPKLEETIHSKLWWGSAAFSYAMLLTNKVNFGIFKTNPLQPWDHSAGVFLYKEAGGISGISDGLPYHPFPTNGSLILASDEDTWQKLTDIVNSNIF